MCINDLAVTDLLSAAGHAAAYKAYQMILMCACVLLFIYAHITLECVSVYPCSAIMLIMLGPTPVIHQHLILEYKETHLCYIHLQSHCGGTETLFTLHPTQHY